MKFSKVPNPQPLARQGELPKLPRRLLNNACHCGRCQRCIDHAREKPEVLRLAVGSVRGFAECSGARG